MVLVLGRGSLAKRIPFSSRPGPGEAELKSPLVEVDGIDEARDTCSRCDGLASGSLVDGA